MIWIPNPLAQSAQAYPDRVALVSGDHILTYETLKRRVEAMSLSLINQGVKPGQRVWLNPSTVTEWAMGFHAIGWCGAVAVMVDPNLPLSIQTRVRGTTQAKQVDWAVKGLNDTAEVKAQVWHLEDPRLVVLSSGSTGQPKVISLRTHQLLFNAMGSALRLGHHLEDRWLNCLPLFHIGGASILFRCALYGTATEVMESFQPETVARRLDSGEITQVSLVPTMLKRVLDARRKRPFPSVLRNILVGGAPCPSELRAQCQEMNLPVQFTWGMTESASQVCTQVPGQMPNTQNVGPPLPFSTVQVHEGRLMVDGPTVAESILTLDQGEISLGQVTIFGREDDMIISGGKKIAPQPIVHRLMAHHGISDAAVIGTPCADWGERVTAILSSELTPVPSTAGLQAWCKATLPSESIPKMIFWVPEIPRTPLGKVNRSALRRIIRDRETDMLKGMDELVGTRSSLERRDGDECMLKTHSASLDSVTLTSNGILEGDGAATEGNNGHPDGQAVTSTHGTKKAGLGVDQGETQIQSVEDRVHAAKSGGQHLFKADMGVLKSPAEENDARAINLVETGSDISFEKHSNPLDGRRTDKR